jgi:hypothetical protein
MSVSRQEDIASVQSGSVERSDHANCHAQTQLTRRLQEYVECDVYLRGSVECLALNSDTEAVMEYTESFAVCFESFHLTGQILVTTNCNSARQKTSIKLSAIDIYYPPLSKLHSYFGAEAIANQIASPGSPFSPTTISTILS